MSVWKLEGSIYMDLSAKLSSCGSLCNALLLNSFQCLISVGVSWFNIMFFRGLVLVETSDYCILIFFLLFRGITF